LRSKKDLTPIDGLNIINKYKFLILSFVILGALIAGVNAYYKPYIYEATASIQFNSDSKNLESTDLLTEAILGSRSSDIDTAKEVISSRSLVLEALKKVDLTTHIWGLNRLYKATELYDNTPFIPKVYKGLGLIFYLKPKDNNSFILEVKGKNQNGDKINFRGEFKFNQIIQNDNFKVKIVPTGKEFKYFKYKFSVDSPIITAQNIINNSLSVSRRNKKANILDISFQDTVPVRAKEFVNELTKVYLKRNIEQKTQNATQTLKFINEQLKLLQGNLQKSQKNIEEFKSRENTMDIKLSAQEISKKIEDYDSKLAILNMKIKILKDTIDKIDKGKDLSTLTLVGLGVDSASVNELTKELQQALLDRKALLQDYTYKHPVVRKLTDRIENLKAIIKESILNILKGLNEQKKIFLSQKERYIKELKKLPKAEQNYLTLQREFNFNNKFYTYLLEKKTETEIKKAATANQNKILDYAITPNIPIKPKRKLIVTVGAMAGGVLGVLVAFFLNARDNTIKSEEDLEEIDAPIVASIPKYNSQNSRDLIVLKEPKSPIAESFRLLRTNLQFLISNNQRGVVIAVTSTVAGEGKTTIASNLALSLNMLEKRVIVINFDLRKPTLHKVFNLPNGYGLSGYLSNQVGLDKILKHTDIDNLDIISAGAVPPNPSELINSPKVQELIERLKKYYDYIILDTPPVGLVTDARVLIRSADIILYVVRANYTKKEFVKIIKEVKSQTKRGFYIVLNDIKVDFDSNYSYGYYK